MLTNSRKIFRHQKPFHRSERLHVKLTPKERFALEIMAREKKCSLSALVVGFIDEAMKQTKVSLFVKHRQSHVPFLTVPKYKQISLQVATAYLWRSDELDCFIRFAYSFPHLLTEAEQSIWRFLTESVEIEALNDQTADELKKAITIKLKKSYPIFLRMIENLSLM